jgi:hypothetical protein
MAKFTDIVKIISVIAVIVFFASFALGAFDGDGVSVVHDKDYDEFTFSGNLRNGRFTGYGSMYFQGGERYSGSFTLGRFDGEGAMHCPLLAWNFDGFFDEGRVGSGIFQDIEGEAITYERGEIADTLISSTWMYEGGLNEHGQNGIGTFTFADGSVYAGGFAFGLAEGEGTLYNTYGEFIYSGGFAEGRFEGLGKYTSPEGWTYEGSFKEGLFDGEGILTTDTETIRGVWEKGVQVTRYE